MKNQCHFHLTEESVEVYPQYIHVAAMKTGQQNSHMFWSGVDAKIVLKKANYELQVIRRTPSNVYCELQYCSFGNELYIYMYRFRQELMRICFAVLTSSWFRCI